MPALVFDIETSCLPLERLPDVHGPFDPSQYPHPGEFDPNSVKVGNLGSAKAAEKIAGKRAEHEAAIEQYDQLLVNKKAEYEAGLIEKAALCAGTGCVLAIGYMMPDGRSMIADGNDDEAALIRQFWSMLQAAYAESPQGRYIGHCIHSFDMPFLVRRSWLLGVDFPSWVLDKNRRYWHPMLVDTAAVWGCGVWGDRVSLDLLSAYFGGPRKNGSGADFARLWREDRKAAIAYLRRDLECTLHVATSLRLFDGLTNNGGAAGDNGRSTPPAAPVAQPEQPKGLRSATNAKSVDGDVEHARELIDQIMGMVEDLPEDAEDFGSSASETAGSINNYIDQRDRVTAKQVTALENILDGLSRWVRT
jgi:hypothetical protein